MESRAKSAMRKSMQYLRTTRPEVRSMALWRRLQLTLLVGEGRASLKGPTPEATDRGFQAHPDESLGRLARLPLHSGPPQSAISSKPPSLVCRIARKLSKAENWQSQTRDN